MLDENTKVVSSGLEVLHDDGLPGGPGSAESRDPLRQSGPKPQVRAYTPHYNISRDDGDSTFSLYHLLQFYVLKM